MPLWRESKAGNSVYHKTPDGFVAIVWWQNSLGDYFGGPKRKDPETKYGFMVKDTELVEEQLGDDDCDFLEEAKTKALDLLASMRQDRETAYVVRDTQDDSDVGDRGFTEDPECEF